MSRRVGTVLAVAFALTYNNWVLWPLNGDPRVLAGFLSELGAATQPFHTVFRNLDILAGLLLLVTIAWGRHRWAGRLAPPRVTRWVVVLLTVFAVGAITDASVPMTCSATLDPGCPTFVDPRDWPLNQWAHSIVSVVLESALVASMALVALRGSQRWRRPARIALAISISAHLTMLVLAATWQGEAVPQMVLMLTQGAWIILLGRAGDRPTPVLPRAEGPQARRSTTR
ncbi:Protein of unknown function [Raineyella antarctica]|uniref:DUF998 domain-containing protein n=1 Tax=Raineyella antarctica TaxID=1577474 RepID=A0A1G6GD53_9ACTN|nr:DUF998 domain-containing protein [Raineyella antarctica]SDB79932.1 Protein of unknown function [Raineyella antarctica]